MRFVDPACGSGSFLVGAYSFLLRHHLDYFTATPNDNAKHWKTTIYTATRTPTKSNCRSKPSAPYC